MDELRKAGGAADDHVMAKLAPTVLAAGLNGSSGPVTFVRTPYGVVVKDRVVPRDPRTEAQIASRERLKRAARAWTALTTEQALAWREYARQQAEALGGPDSPRPPSAQLLFTRLGVKVLQVDPFAPIPALPPSTPFLGDGLGLTVEPTAEGLRFVSDAANTPGVLTELLVQRLANPHRNAYPERYRSKAFVPFAGAGAAFDLALTPGVYAVAYRFVRAATGQETALAVIRVLATGFVSVG